MRAGAAYASAARSPTRQPAYRGSSKGVVMRLSVWLSAAHRLKACAGSARLGGCGRAFGCLLCVEDWLTTALGEDVAGDCV